MFSKSRIFLFVIFVLLVFPVAFVFAQSGGTEGEPTQPPPIVETSPEVQNFHVFLPILSKVVLETDIAIADVQISPNPAAIGDTVHFSFTVTNLGLTPTVEFPVDWKVLPLGETEPLASGTFMVSTLTYGQTVVLEADYLALVAGPFDVQVMADPLFDNPDPIHANNFRSVELGVTGIVEFCGDLTKDTIWAYATYVVGCNVELPEGINFLVRTGAVIKPTQQWVLFNVYGNLELRGTETVPVVITSINDESYGEDANGDQTIPPSAGEWNKIFIGSTGVVNASHALLRYGLTPFWSDLGHLQVSDSVLEYFGAATHSNNGFIDLQNNVIRGSYNNGLLYYNNGPFIAEPILIGNQFEDNVGNAVVFGSYYEYTLDTSQVYGNSATNNDFNGIQLTGTLGGNSVLRNAGIPYILEIGQEGWESIYVPVGGTLTIQPGTIFKMLPGNYTYENGTGLEIAGTLLAQGTELEPIVFTSIKDDSYGGDTNNDGDATTPEAGNWTRHLIHTGATATFEHVIMKYGGGQLSGQSMETVRSDGGELHLLSSSITNGGGTGIRIVDGVLDVQDSYIGINTEHGIAYTISSQAAPIIKNSTINNNSAYAIFLSFNEMTLDASQVYGNSATGNAVNGIPLTGTLLGDSIIGQSGIPYVLDMDNDHARSIYVPAGSNLTINAGAIFKVIGNNYNNSVGSGVEVLGTLNAMGTSEAPIIFTSRHDDTVGGDTNNDGSNTTPVKGDWTSLLVQSGGSATFDYVTISYAGGSLYGQPAEGIRNDGGSLQFHHGLIDQGAMTGIRSLNNGILDVSGSTIQFQNEYGIYYSASGEAAPIIQNNTFDSNTSFAIYFAPFGELTLDGTQMSGNTAIGNGTNALRLIGALTGSSTLQNPGFAILLDYNPDRTLSLHVLAGSTLTIQPGTTFKGYGNSYNQVRGSGIEVSGTLIAVGTSDEPIVFTSLHDDTYGGDTNNDGSNTVPASGSWTMNYIGAGGVATFEHNLLRYAGGQIYGIPQESIYNAGGTLHLSDSTVEYGSGTGVRSEASGVIDIQGNTFKSNTEYGIYYSASGEAAPIIQNNTFDSNTSFAIYFNPSGELTLDSSLINDNSALNNGTNALRLIGALTGSSTLQNPGFAILLDYNPDRTLSLHVLAGSTLTIQPGTIFKGYGTSYSAGRGSGIEVSGTLIAVGTSDEAIVFTSLHDDTYGGDTNNNGSDTVPAAGQWSFHYIGTGGTATFEHTILRYAGGSIYGMPQETIFNSGGIVSLDNSVVDYSANYGILQNSGDLEVIASQISNNVIGVSVAAGSGSTSFIDSDFLGNQFGIDFAGNASTTTQNCIFEGNVQYGYRNQTSQTIDVTNNWWGDASGPSPYGIGDAVSGNLTVNPWLTVRPR